MLEAGFQSTMGRNEYKSSRLTFGLQLRWRRSVGVTIGPVAGTSSSTSHCRVDPDFWRVEMLVEMKAVPFRERLEEGESLSSCGVKEWIPLRPRRRGRYLLLPTRHLELNVRSVSLDHRFRR